MHAEFDGLLFPKLTLPVYYPEDTLVLKPNEIASWAYWPITGFTRTYEEYKPENDSETVKQKTVGISVPGKVTLPANSFMNQSKSEYFVEITKGSTMVGFSYEAFKDLGTQMPEVFMLSNQIVTKENEDREIERKMRELAYNKPNAVMGSYPDVVMDFTKVLTAMANHANDSVGSHLQLLYKSSGNFEPEAG